MKILIKDLLIILFIMLFLIIGFAADLGHSQYYPRASVVIEQAPAYYTQKLNINSTIVNQPLVQILPELQVIDNKIDKNEQVQKFKKVIVQQEWIEDTFVDQEYFYQEVYMEGDIENVDIDWFVDYYYDYDDSYYDQVVIIDDYDYDYNDDYYDYNDYNDYSLGQQIVNYAEQWVGVTPYVSWYNRDYSSLEQGTDCSGFVSLVYNQFGIDTSAASDDYQYMSNIDYEDLQPGDIVVYGYGSHVGIYAGEDTIIHCSNEDVGTIESDMWYRDPTGYVHIGD